MLKKVNTFYAGASQIAPRPPRANASGGRIIVPPRPRPPPPWGASPPVPSPRKLPFFANLGFTCS